jgi:dTDP-4-amino-4,6-dideoxygalactose transaminase
MKERGFLAASTLPGTDRCGMPGYEGQFAGFFPKDTQAFAFWKGRVALHAILESLGVGPGDEVIMPGFTCVVVPNAVLYRGAIPVYVDIEGSSFTMDVRDIERKITNRTKVIIVQHTYGIPAEMDGIMALVSKAKIAVIEDCAHALGSTYKDRIVGSIGDAAFFSSQWSKPYTTGMGGMAVTADRNISRKLASVQAQYSRPGLKEVSLLRLQMTIYHKFFTPRLYWSAMRTLQVLSKTGLFIASSSKEELVGAKPVGYEKRMSEFQALRGLRELSHLKENLASREQLTGLYSQLLRDAGFDPLTIPRGGKAVLLRYPLLVKNKPAVLAQARRRSIEIGSWFDSVIHPAGTPLKDMGYLPGQCPVAERVVRHIVNLPLHRRVSESDALRTVEFMKEMRGRGYA